MSDPVEIELKLSVPQAQREAIKRDLLGDNAESERLLATYFDLDHSVAVVAAHKRGTPELDLKRHDRTEVGALIRGLWPCPDLHCQHRY